MQRISVVGNCGSGKSTLSKALAVRLGALHVELDSIVHQPGWTRFENGELRRRVADVVAGQQWVVDGNYSTVRDLVWARADTVVWLDLPRRVVMARILKRTAGRVLLRKELWNGNRERLSEVLRLDPEQSVVAWAWTHDTVYRRTYEVASVDPAWAHLTFVRLRTRREVELFA